MDLVVIIHLMRHIRNQRSFNDHQSDVASTIKTLVNSNSFITNFQKHHMIIDYFSSINKCYHNRVRTDLIRQIS